jgi:peptidyl-prolyl cis-trans isomerase D
MVVFAALMVILYQDPGQAGQKKGFDARKKAFCKLMLKHGEEAFKKGKLKSSETLTLSIDDSKLTPEIWSEIKQKSIGDILKPKVVSNSYATVKIINIIEPKVMPFEEAKEAVTKEYRLHAQKEGLLRLANTTLKNFNEINTTISDFVTLEKHNNLKLLNSQESLQFLQKLFTSSKEKGTIHIPNRVIVYNIIDQKLLPMDENRTNLIKNSIDQIKKRVFETNFLKILDKRYSTEVYIGGVTN